MKKILIALTIIVLAVVVIIQAFRIRRLSAPENYEYSFSEDIDLDYFDSDALKSYYDTGYEAGSFAREMWKNRGLNVRMPESDDVSNRVAVKRYHHLLAYTDSLGAKLKQSKLLKNAGYSNSEIKMIQNEGLDAQLVKIHRLFGGTELKIGDKGKHVYKLQSILISKGYQMPHDGYFFTETEVAVRDFQNKQKLYASGIADQETLEALIR